MTMPPDEEIYLDLRCQIAVLKTDLRIKQDDNEYYRRMYLTASQQAAYYHRIVHLAKEDDDIMSALVQLTTLIQLKTDGNETWLDLPIRDIEKTEKPQND